MKETVEQAAGKELIHSYQILDKDSTCYGGAAMLNMFRKGAEWQTKQSPWIKTSERLPIPIIEMVDGEEYGSVFVIGRTSKWETPDLHSYYGYDGDYKWEDGHVPEYWCPIPELPKE